MVWSSFGRGLGRAGKNIRLVLIAYAANLAAALILTYPVYKMLESTLGMSGISEGYFSAFPFHWINTWFFHNSPAVGGYQQVLITAGVSYLLFQVFLLGGILEILTKPDEKFSLSRFFGGIGAHVWGFLFLFIVSSVIYGVILLYGNGLLEDALEKIHDRFSGEWMSLILTWVRWVILGAVLAGFSALFDYTRIMYVLGRPRWIIAALVKSIGFMLRNIWKTFWLYYLLAVAAAIIIAGYLYAVSRFDMQSVKEMGIIFGLQQVYILLRTWIRLSFYSAQTILYEKINPVKISGEESEEREGLRPEIDFE